MHVLAAKEKEAPRSLNSESSLKLSPLGKRDGFVVKRACFRNMLRETFMDCPTKKKSIRFPR